MLEYRAVTSNVTRVVLSGRLPKLLNLLKKSVVSLFYLGMFASRGWSSLSTNADIGTLTEYVSAFVDRELQPLLANIPSY